MVGLRIAPTHPTKKHGGFIAPTHPTKKCNSTDIDVQKKQLSNNK
jgi:hypothetical protein